MTKAELIEKMAKAHYYKENNLSDTTDKKGWFTGSPWLELSQSKRDAWKAKYSIDIPLFLEFIDGIENPFSRIGHGINERSFNQAISIIKKALE